MKILIVKASSLGDIVQSNPVLTALKEIFPQSSISWLVNKTWAGILDLFPGIDEKVVWDGSIKELFLVRKKIRSEKFDLIIDLQGLFRTSLPYIFSNAKQILGGPGMRELSWLFAKEISPEKRSMLATLRNLEVVKYLTKTDISPKFIIAENEEAKRKIDKILSSNKIASDVALIGFVPQTRGKRKEWPKAYYQKLIELCGNKFKGFKAVIIGTSGASEGLSSDNILDLSGKTDQKELASILKKCDLVIGGDTGPTHLSAAMDIPTIMIFGGGADPKRTAPISAKCRVIYKDLPCFPCKTKKICFRKDCILDISPEEVFLNIEELLQ